MSVRAILLLAVFSSYVYAAEWSAGIGVESRLSQKVNSVLDQEKTLPKLFANWRKENWSANLAISTWGENSRVGALAVSSETRELLLWGRRHFALPLKLEGLAGLGVGVEKTQVVTTLNDQEVKTSGNPEGKSGLQLGVVARLGELKHFYAESDFMLLRNFSDQRDTYGFDVKLGYQF